MPRSPRKPSQTRKSPTESHSPAKDGACKKNEPYKSIENYYSSIYSSWSADDSSEITSVEESNDNTNTTPTHMIISQFDITYEYEDSAGYEPTDK